MKKILILSSIISMSMIFTSCTKVIENNKLTTRVNSKMTLEEAKNIALKHANLDISQVSFIKAEYDLDDGIEKYDIEFYYNNKEYDYEIDVKTGNIIGYDYDIENYSILQQVNSTSNSKITLEEAKNIALKHANLDISQVSFIKAKYDLDDGMEKYDIEFYYNNKEYDYEIDVKTGNIIGYDYDIENYSILQQVNSTNNSKITLEEAKNIALKHANLGASQVLFIKAELDLDDGIEKYDIEFYHNNKEFNYEINASNGVITEYEID
ncbi:PepSY domain-containing protein [Clostridium sp. DSM 100503]|uniref:PepSY domain-containing protein n=1 Tax=Clostridium sp. DSM 100503 TaxID=2963282 RepID=UPI00214A46A9|nr:PepSY domain-containing protein [Clostridium sp. DSM 100503]MCR1952914.1 PepSY domain-containing protein [Clostridium sp. DSM 100503]